MRDVRFLLKKINKKNFKATLFLGFVGILFTGCVSKRDAICEELPQSVVEVASFKRELDLHKAERRIASGSRLKALPHAPDEPQVKAWMYWAEESLKKTQRASDVLAEDKSSRRAQGYLNEAGLALVSLHGYLDQKKWGKASAQLDVIEGSLEKVERLVCVTRKPSSERIKIVKKASKN